MAHLPDWVPSRLRQLTFFQITWAIAASAWVALLAAWQWPLLPFSGEPLLSLALHFAIYFPVCALGACMLLGVTGLPSDRTVESKNIERIGRLDHLRFLAAALVVLYHYFDKVIPFDPASTNILFNVMTEGRLGVDIFFVLSGFIFGMIGYQKKIRYFDFLWSRVVRIYPLYLFAIMLVLAVYPEKYAPLDSFILMAPILVPGYIFTLPGFTQLWTVGLEFQFYLIFPFLAAFLIRNGYKYLGVILLFAMGVRALYFIELGSIRNLSYGTLPGRIDQFVAGMGSAWFFINKRALFSHAAHLIVSAILALAYFQWLYAWDGQGGGSNSMLWIVWPAIDGAIWGYLIVSYLSCRITIPAFLDESLTKLGAMSFSLYVMHDFAVSWTLKYAGSLSITGSAKTDAALKGVFICLPFAVIIAWGTYHLIEKQFFIYRRKYVEAVEARA